MTATETRHNVVSRDEWLKARLAHLTAEKELSRKRDELSRQRRELPWVRVEKNYVFEGPNGPERLADLFAGRSQLIVYHFMLGPGWKAGCPGCSFLCDHIDGALPHLNHHDVTWTAVSSAPMNEIAAYKSRMGWKFPFVSSAGNSFNHDYRVSFSKEELAAGAVDYNFTRTPSDRANDELPGLSAFFKDKEGEIFHTYSSYARGPEEIIGTLMILDRAPLGRNEDGIMNFVRRHDEYENAAE